MWLVAGGKGVPVVSRGQQVDLRVGGQDPEAVVLAPEGLHARALAHVPHTDALVLRIGHNDVLHVNSLSANLPPNPLAYALHSSGADSCISSWQMLQSAVIPFNCCTAKQAHQVPNSPAESCALLRAILGDKLRKGLLVSW